jgi:isocitrate dehydrogenase (NAD+)
MHKITLINGDGTGPEVIDAAVRCVEASGVKVDWDEQMAGEHAVRKHNTPLPEHVIHSIQRNKVCLKGPITTPVGTGFRSVNVGLRQALDLYANVRPARTLPGVKSRYSNVDLVVIRENTEDLYAGIEYENRSSDARKLIKFIKETNGAQLRADTGISVKPISNYATKRITQFAFDFAKQNKRKKVTAVHKANIMKFSDGLFLKSATEVAQHHKKIKFEDRIVDNTCMQLVEDPSQFDILLCPNLYGDILSDLCAGLAGGIGLAPSGNYGTRCAVFEPVHGSAPKYAGKNKVNPGATILSAVMMLRHIGEVVAANKIEKALLSVLRAGKHLTYDLGGKTGTKEMTDAIISKM